MRVSLLSLSLLLVLPTVALAQASNFTPLVGIPGVNNPNNFGAYVNAMYGIAISLAALLAVIKIIIAGVRWMMTDVVTSKGDAKKDIQGALLGLLVVLAAVLILTIINPNLTQNTISLTNIAANNSGNGNNNGGSGTTPLVPPLNSVTTKCPNNPPASCAGQPSCLPVPDCTALADQCTKGLLFSTPGHTGTAKTNNVSANAANLVCTQNQTAAQTQQLADQICANNPSLSCDIIACAGSTNCTQANTCASSGFQLQAVPNSNTFVCLSPTNNPNPINPNVNFVDISTLNAPNLPQAINTLAANLGGFQSFNLAAGNGGQGVLITATNEAGFLNTCTSTIGGTDATFIMDANNLAVGWVCH